MQDGETLAERIQAHEREFVRGLVELIRGRNEEDDDEIGFQSILESCARCGLSQVAIADRFGVSTATVSRWQSGRSLPARYARGVVIEKVVELLVETERARAGAG